MSTTQLDTNNITEAITKELEKLPKDKRLHFFFAYALGLWSEPFKQLKNSNDTSSSICIVKSVLDSFKVALKKEYEDKGKDFTKQDEFLKQIVELLNDVYKDYEANGIDDLNNELDLLASLAGIGHWLLSKSMWNYNWHTFEEPK